MSDDAIFQRRDDDDENDVYFSSSSIMHATTKQVSFGNSSFARLVVIGIKE